MHELEKCCTVKDPFPKDALPKCYQSAEGNEGEKIVVINLDAAKTLKEIYLNALFLVRNGVQFP